MAGRGEAAAALNAYQQGAIFRHQALKVRDSHITCAVMDAALLRDSLGLRADSERLAGAARLYVGIIIRVMGGDGAPMLSKPLSPHCPLPQTPLLHTGLFDESRSSLGGSVQICEAPALT